MSRLLADELPSFLMTEEMLVLVSRIVLSSPVHLLGVCHLLPFLKPFNYVSHLFAHTFL